MSNTKFCLQCGKSIGMFDKVCEYCGTNQYGENNEFYPDEKSMNTARALLNDMNTKEKAKKPRKSRRAFSKEETLALGLYPKDKKYKMSLISKILDK